MEWARRPNYIGGIPQRIVFMAIGAFAKAVASLFSSTSYQNANTLIHLVRSWSPGIPLITISNHMSTSVTLLNSMSFFPFQVYFYDFFSCSYPLWLFNWDLICNAWSPTKFLFQDQLLRLHFYSIWMLIYHVNSKMDLTPKIIKWQWKEDP